MSGYAKAVVAFLVGGLTVAYTALADGSISSQEWIGIVLGALGTPAAVYATPNKTPSRIQALEESMALDPESGESLERVLILVVIVILIVWLIRALILST